MTKIIEKIFIKIEKGNIDSAMRITRNRKNYQHSVTEKGKGSILLLAFLLPVVIVMILFIVRGIYPFGDRSFLFSDMYHQYMPFFSEFLRKIKAGEGLSYSYNVGIGSNFLALYVYYLASPLHWLAFLVPEAFLMEFMSYLAVIKIGLCGCSFAYYLEKHFKQRTGSVLLFSCFYALSGYMAAYNWNIMWLDCVVLFPLIIWGLELLVKENRPGTYCITLALSIFTNYYISIMICIFLVMYFGVLLITEKRSLRIVRDFAIYSLLAGGMAGILLLPEVCAILTTDFGDVSFPEVLESYFPVLDMLARHCMCITTERGLEHWPNIYCGVGVLLLLPLYALNPRIAIRKRFCNLALVGGLLLAFSTNMLDFIWHGFNYPDSLPARQSFLYIFLVLVMCYEAFRRISEVSEKQILYGYLAAVGFLLFCEKFIENEDFDTGVEMLTLSFVTLYGIFLYLYRTRKQVRWQRVLKWLAVTVVVAESFINTDYTTLGTTSRSAYLGQQADYKALYHWALEQEEGFWRMEKFSRKTKNDGTLTGYPTASVFSSTMNSSVMDLYKKLGMRHSKVYYGFDGATAYMAALLNVKYMFGESEHFDSPLYRLVQQSGDIFLYESSYTLPFGYVAPLGYDLPESSSNNGIRLQNLMIQQLGLQGELFVKQTGTSQGNDVRFAAEKPGTYYARLTASGIKKMEAVGGNLEIQSFSDLKNGSVLYLGYMEKGDTITLCNDTEEDLKVAADIYYMDTELLQDALELLQQQHLTEVTYDSTHMNGKLELAKEGRLILSIPYEKGWMVRINGEETEPALFGGCLMAFDLQPGSYTISMEYVPEGRNAGILLSIVCVGLFGLLMLTFGKKKPDRPETHLESGCEE